MSKFEIYVKTLLRLMLAISVSCKEMTDMK